MPPATPTSRSPARIAWSASADRAHARGADLVDGLRGDLLRDPGLDLRLARGDLALAGLEDLAEDDLLDLLGIDRRSARARRSIAVPPSSVASSEARAPPIFPNGVRAVPRITVLGMGPFLSGRRLRRARKR